MKQYRFLLPQSALDITTLYLSTVSRFGLALKEVPTSNRSQMALRSACHVRSFWTDDEAWQHRNMIWENYKGNSMPVSTDSVKSKTFQVALGNLKLFRRGGHVSRRKQQRGTPEPPPRRTQMSLADSHGKVSDRCRGGGLGANGEDGEESDDEGWVGPNLMPHYQLQKQGMCSVIMMVAITTRNWR